MTYSILGRKSRSMTLIMLICTILDSSCDTDVNRASIVRCDVDVRILYGSFGFAQDDVGLLR